MSADSESEAVLGRDRTVGVRLCLVTSDVMKLIKIRIRHMRMQIELFYQSECSTLV